MALWQDIADNVTVGDQVLVYDPDRALTQPGTLSIHEIVGIDRKSQTVTIDGNKYSQFSSMPGIPAESIIFTSDELEEVARVQLDEALDEAYRRNRVFEKWANSRFPMHEPEYPIVDAFGCWREPTRPGYPCIVSFALLSLDEKGNLIDERRREVEIFAGDFAATYLDEDLDQHIDNIIAAASSFLCY